MSLKTGTRGFNFLLLLFGVWEILNNKKENVMHNTYEYNNNDKNELNKTTRICLENMNRDHE